MCLEQRAFGQIIWIAVTAAVEVVIAIDLRNVGRRRRQISKAVTTAWAVLNAIAIFNKQALGRAATERTVAGKRHGVGLYRVTWAKLTRASTVGTLGRAATWLACCAIVTT